MSERPMARIGDAIRNHGLMLSDHRGYRAQRAPGDVAFDTDMAAAAGAALVLVTVKSAAAPEAAAQLPAWRGDALWAALAK
ncbi:hypothetical protein [Burkholderia ubonensis]|uniref:hypothetical protein n=1 Tax=Burkholderia ubonensis TaxID=101571 RepID=UPI003F752980